MSTLRRELIEKAVTSSGVSDFIPTIVAAEFIKNLREKNIMRQNFRTINMPSAVYNVPRVSTGTTVYYVSEGSTAPETSVSSGVMALTAKKLFAQVLVNEEAIEDAVANMMEVVREDFVDAMATAEERAMIQGDSDYADTTETEGDADADTWYTKDSRLAFDGALALAESGDAATKINADSGSMTTSLVNRARYGLGKFGRYASNLIMVVNPISAKQLREDDKIVTIDKFGPQATIKLGWVTTVYGINIIESGQCTDGYAFCCPKDNLVIGDRRKIKVKTEEVIESDQRRIVLSERIAFSIRYPGGIIEIYGLSTDAST